MPIRPSRPCRKAGCRALTRDKDGYCDNHKPEIKAFNRLFDDHRGNAASRGYDWRWAKVRKLKLAMNPVCECGCGQVADTVHHIQPIDRRPELRLAIDNLMALARECHERVERGLNKRY